ncbi:hypothetical protein [Halomontanus rarus]|uniref:hypothetical protein n=1 Tax=Halomontanus rarus TaxID=3034020 RepID=UPI0023E80E99|nr:hypothetical protein [Halovivax sp. TS33]
MDGDGGGIDGGGMAGMNGGGMVDMDGDGRTDGDYPDAGTSALESMGYIDSGTRVNGTGRDSTSSWASVLKSVVTTAVMVFFGVCFVYFLLGGILAMFGVQL